MALPDNVAPLAGLVKQILTVYELPPGELVLQPTVVVYVWPEVEADPEEFVGLVWLEPWFGFQGAVMG